DRADLQRGESERAAVDPEVRLDVHHDSGAVSRSGLRGLVHPARRRDPGRHVRHRVAQRQEHRAAAGAQFGDLALGPDRAQLADPAAHHLQDRADRQRRFGRGLGRHAPERSFARRFSYMRITSGRAEVACSYARYSAICSSVLPRMRARSDATDRDAKPGMGSASSPAPKWAGSLPASGTVSAASASFSFSLALAGSALAFAAFLGFGCSSASIVTGCATAGWATASSGVALLSALGLVSA